MPFTFLKDLYQHGTIILDESLKQSAIPAKLIQNYVTAHYQARIDSGTLTLLIGQHSKLLSKLMKEYGTQCVLYITACNPHSQPQDREANLTASNQLFVLLSTLSNHIFSGKSSDPAGKWPAESSFLALGIDFVASKTLGRQFDQNAIVWVDLDAIPRLILLR
ncbi:DUF3293 domain-containing protein [Nitrosomonas sp. Is37]|uniref:DUF3293 domain-containing protein n=1 Tax=Nitrosomonas sp. Is37 TaxID=3080535 RepID=UPI00294ACAF0|nr:DUF3293 domain-containing protein [Nitrosomonas sp. Is37]MDV6345765.1 DUF3293 domain-containing protein [Nitrosomonas sp. Is37]